MTTKSILDPERTPVHTELQILSTDIGVVFADGSVLVLVRCESDTNHSISEIHQIEMHETEFVREKCLICVCFFNHLLLIQLCAIYFSFSRFAHMVWFTFSHSHVIRQHAQRHTSSTPLPNVQKNPRFIVAVLV